MEGRRKEEEIERRSLHQQEDGIEDVAADAAAAVSTTARAIL